MQICHSCSFLKFRVLIYYFQSIFFVAGNINSEMTNHEPPGVLRHGSTGSTGSFRSNSGSLSNPPTPTNNTPLVVPQPMKPNNMKAGRTYQCKMCDQVICHKLIGFWLYLNQKMVSCQ